MKSSMQGWIGRWGLLALIFAAPASAEAPLRLEAQAFLFNSRTGQLSQDVLAKGAPQLGNVPAGEFASVSTLVVLKVQFPPKSPVPAKLQIRLEAVEAGGAPFAKRDAKAPNRVLLDRTNTLGPVSEAGVSYTGFWLYNTGCRTITLKATAIRAPGAVPLSTVLPFTCYE